MNRQYIPTNPFTYGNIVKDPNSFFGREDEIRNILDGLWTNQSISLVGDIRMGKSSLLSMLMNPSVTKRFGNENYLIPTYVNLDILNKDATPVQFWNLVLRNLKQQSNDTSIIAKVDSLFTGQEPDLHDYHTIRVFLQSLQQHTNNLPITLLLDEVEAIAQNLNFNLGFMNQLRAWMQEDLLSLVMSSRTHLNELFALNINSTSPFFSVFMTIHLKLFSLDEAHNLIIHGLQKTSLSFRESEISFLIQIAGKHPFLLKVAAYFLFDAYLNGYNKDMRQKYVNEKFFQEAAQHYSYIWKNTSEVQKIVLTALSLLSKQYQASKYGMSSMKLQEYIGEASEAIWELKTRCLVTEQNGEFRLFSSSFTSWVIREIKAAVSEPSEYKTWLKNHDAQTGIAKLSKGLADEVKSEILPRIAVNYRDMILTWLTDPKTVASVIALLRSSVR